jgi:mono/diheme cytochrome c family protein
MRFHFSTAVIGVWLGSCALLSAKITPEQAKQLPPPANHPVDFSKEVKPIFESSCIKCHGRGRDKGSFRLDTRETLLKGGDSGAAIVPGKSEESYLIELVQGFDPDEMMPKKGTKLTPEQIGILRAWIDQGAKYDPGFTFGKLEPANLKPHRPELPAGDKGTNPIDRLLQPYFAAHHIKAAAPVNDRLYARRVYLDTIGLLPTPEQLDAFEKDKRPDKRVQLVRSLLADNQNYAIHWMSFWNDMLRNDYRGTGYIDGGRKQITGWLYSALAKNMPYDKFVAELINPIPESEGFTKGIVWRGSVNASQTPQMQAAQSISQVFMGVNLKCASCHDSFINDLTLADAYGLAGLYAEGPLEMVHCDKPTGKKAELKFIYPELGQIDPKADKATRLKQLAEIVAGRQDARLTRTIVNRLWQKFMGRGLIEPADEMEKVAWNQDLLDWLSEDLADQDYDLKKTMERILTSKAYQMPAVSWDEKNNDAYVFMGPVVRRMSAEQFRDALGEVAGIWYDQPVAQVDFSIGTTNQTLDAPFAAKYIWSEAEAAKEAKPGTSYFRKVVVLENTPASALGVITADNSFTLFVNGKKAGAGKKYDEMVVVDLRKHLVKGTNYIAITAVNEGDKPNPAGLFMYAYVRAGGKKSQVMDFGTDKSWVWSTTKVKDWDKPKFAAANWSHAFELGGIGTTTWNMEPKFKSAMLAPEQFGKVRSALVNADVLQVALGRPNREQVVTSRLSAATTLQALELTNGRELSELMKKGSEKLMTENSDKDLVTRIYMRALGRKPTGDEMKLAQEMVGKPLQGAGVEDLLWAVTMLPEFQLIY